MCGIVGYIGEKDSADIALCALKRMEYRGYDSYGICIIDNNDASVFKRVGKIRDTEKDFLNLNLKGKLAIGHSRWATTGKVTENNAHPHIDCKKEIFVVHNGIIENYKEIKKTLLREGHIFTSDTDTEVVSHLIEKYYSDKLEDAVCSALKHVRGTFGILVVSTREPDKVVAARMSSPVIIGVGNGEMLVVSDPGAVITMTRNMVVLEDGEVAIIKKDGFSVIKDGKSCEKNIEYIDWIDETSELGDYEHYMYKEIFEIPQTIENAIAGRLIPDQGNVRLGGIESKEKYLRKIENVICVGCGTAYYAAKMGEYIIEEISGLRVKSEIGSELRYRRMIIPDNSMIVSISQSGETADTLAALREVKKHGILTVGVTNVVGSSQSRETDCGVYTRTGPEIAVASTKAFIGQVIVLVMLAIYLGRQRNMLMTDGSELIEELNNLPEKATKVLGLNNNIFEISRKYCKYKKVWFVGRKFNYPISMEGAWKLREISYIPSGADAGGELKHGSLAIVDEDCLVVAICTKDSVYDKMIMNIEEIKARGGVVVAIATEGDTKISGIVDDVIFIPRTHEILTPILSVIPIYMFSYFFARLLGRDIDKPKNLAKSVTVE